MRKYLLTTAALLFVPCATCAIAQRSPRAAEPQKPPQLDETGSFLPSPLAKGDVAQIGGKAISGRVYMRYLAARMGHALVEDLVFQTVVAAECRARKLATKAAAIAHERAVAALRKDHRHAAHEGHEHEHAPSAEEVIRVANDILHRLRVDALVQADRQVAEAKLRALFHDRYGVDGKKVVVRHLLVSFPATRRRLSAGGANPDATAVEKAAARRAQKLRAEIDGGTELAKLLASSDDPTAKSLLADPRYASRAGFIEGYNYQRYGIEFADAVRAMQVGAIQGPVRTSHGFHLIQLLSRKTTRLQDVRSRLKDELRAQPATPAEARALRRALFAKHKVRLGG